MITVSHVEPLGKGKYQLSLDNGLEFQLYRGELRSMNIAVGSSLTEEQYEALMHLLTVRAQKRAVYLLEKMDRTEKQLREKLLSNNYPVKCIEDAIVYLKEHHFLDDYRYACTYVRYHGEKLSRQMLKQKLQQKGVRSADIEAALEEEYVAEEYAMIVELLEKKHYNAEICDQKEFQRTYQFLLRRGFKSNEILKAMRTYIA